MRALELAKQSRGLERSQLRNVKAVSITASTAKYEVTEWSFSFADNSGAVQTVNVNSSGKLSSLAKAEHEQTHAVIKNWNIDSVEAVRIGTNAGGILDPTLVRLELYMTDVDGETAPVWVLPHGFGTTVKTALRGVRGDNGKIVYYVAYHQGQPAGFTFTKKQP